MTSYTRAIMQWILFAFAMISLVGGLTMLHVLGYHSEHGISTGEDVGIVGAFLLGVILFAVAGCNNKTVASITELVLFLLGLLFLLGNIISPLVAVYGFQKSPPEGLVLVTVFLGIAGLVVTILCAIGFDTLSGVPSTAPEETKEAFEGPTSSAESEDSSYTPNSKDGSNT